MNREENSHHGPPDVLGGYDALLLAVHGLGEQREGLLDLALLARRDVVLLRELRLPFLGQGVFGPTSRLPLRWLRCGGEAVLVK